MTRDLFIYIICALFLFSSVIDLYFSSKKGGSKKRPYSLSTWGMWLGLLGIVLEDHSPSKNLAFILILHQALQAFMTLNLNFKPDKPGQKKSQF